jgi:mannose-6-phosphate isomerase-like protein (cupin superfamily)
MSYPDPRYDGNTGEISASFRPANAAAELVLGGGNEAHYLATGASTHGQFGLYRWDMGAGSGGPSTHFHRTISESFFVLSGTVQLYNGERWTTAGPGDFLYVPEGGLHAFRNESGEAASMLILFAPGAPREGYFEGLVDMAVSGRSMNAEEWREFCEGHDTYFVADATP